jgi:hypothetical protein
MLSSTLRMVLKILDCFGMPCLEEHDITLVSNSHSRAVYQFQPVFLNPNKMHILSILFVAI